jgi:DNA-binding response OmpR family regulator
MTLPILLVEDDITLQAIMSGYLESGGLSVEAVASGHELLRRIAARAYALVLLDLGLPDEDGLVLLRKLRGRTAIPIMVVTARSTVETRLAAFELCAADVLTKPFDPRELRYRVVNLLTRQATGEPAEARYLVGHWEIDAYTRTVRSGISGRRCALTRAEFDLLLLLLRGNGRVFSRAQIIDAVTSASEPESDRAIDILVSRLRRKLSSEPGQGDLITTVRGLGYRIDSGAPEGASDTPAKF